MKWWIENTVSGIGWEYIGTFNDAIVNCQEQFADCGPLLKHIGKYAVYDSNNRKIAEIGWGTRWIHQDYRK